MPKIIDTVESHDRLWDVVEGEGPEMGCAHCIWGTFYQKGADCPDCGGFSDYLIQHLPCTGAKRCPQADDVTCEECEKGGGK